MYKQLTISNIYSSGRVHKQLTISNTVRKLSSDVQAIDH